MSHPTIYVMAGEASGDAIGAKLMRALRAQNPQAKIVGTGGEKMQAEGLSSLFPIQDIAHMGFIEYLPHLPTILKRLRQVVADVHRMQPDVLVTIDAPGFNKQVVERCQALRQQGMRCVHYVAPTVWAYRPARAGRYAKLYDHLLAILPFEPPYFEQEGLACTFVGHPVHEDPNHGDAAKFRQQHAIPNDAPLLCVLPGSRRGELSHHVPIFQQMVEQLRATLPALHVVVLRGQGLKDADIQLSSWGGQVTCVDGSEKQDAFAASNVALAKSGTVTMELAQAGVPMVVAYRTGSFSMRVIRKLSHIRFANLLNIVKGREIIPELIQENCKPELLTQEVLRLLQNEEARVWQCREVAEAWDALKAPDEQLPSQLAARTILNLAN
jgi:lipid-A-disaccharide synthase